jgi:TonB-dependent SusC/RagA subfamily outer membrane receptor
MRRCKQLFFISFLLLAPFLLFAQSKKVTGTVTDSSGRGIPSVTVTEKGTRNSAATNSDGSFTLNISNSNATLIFSSVGYINKEVDVDDETSMNVVLTTSVANLGDVVVVGYGSQRKKDVTGSVASVSTKNFNSTPIANAGEGIEGRASGVQVIASGAPGSNVTFRIRGTGTINDASPLIVVDGVPTDAPLNNINSNDIASIDILKDASASAIYGSRGANGVVLITTKKRRKWSRTFII